MATSSQKKKNSTPYSSPASTSRRSNSTRSKSTQTAVSRTRKTSHPPVQPIRREVGAIFCLLLSLFTLLGCLGIKAVFIDFITGASRGLFGFGSWLFPVAFLGCALILYFHHGHPVCARVFCALLIPIFVSSLLHVLLSKSEFPWNNTLFSLLWEGGRANTCGGAVSGFMALLLVAIFSKFGACLILTLVLTTLLMVIFRITPEDILEWFETRPHLEYEPEPEPEPKRSVKNTHTPKAPGSHTVHSGASPSARKRMIDIPVDDVPISEPAPEPKPEPEKVGFFDRRPRVPTPDQILTGISPDKLEIPPRVSSRPPVPPPEPLIPFSPEERSARSRVKTEDDDVLDLFPPVGHTPRDVPPMPKIVREPAVSSHRPKKKEKVPEYIALDPDPAESFSRLPSAYESPPLDLLHESNASDAAGVAGELRANQARLEEAIRSFGIDAKMIEVTRGPSITRYELELDQGVRLNKLTNLSEDIALALGASGVRIAPIPGKISVVGIEVPNTLVTTVSIREVISSKAFREHRSNIAFALGMDISGHPIVGDIAQLPHLLIAGTTGSGKSVCTNSLIISLLYKAAPEEVRLIMIDPKMVELGIYNGIPHLLIPVVTDPKKAAGALQWAVTEMMRRYRTFSEIGVRKLEEYNAKAAGNGEMERIPAIIVVIDELADLMLAAAKEVEESICRVAQMGRAAGIHLIIATQRPSADVITGLMKANIPSRIAFAVASSLESRIILDQTGAEKLVGRGDMLYFPIGKGKPIRVQGCFISDEEVAQVTEFIKDTSGTVEYDKTVMHDIEQNAAGGEKDGKGAGTQTQQGGEEPDDLLPKAIAVVVETGTASISLLQRELKLGYSRAARMMEQMEKQGIVGALEGSKGRQVRISKAQWQEIQRKEKGGETETQDVTEENMAHEPQELPPFTLGEEDF